MIKNIILDIGGVMFDDGKKLLNEVLRKDASDIYHKAYGKGFNDCILGYNTVSNLIESLKNDPDYEDLSYILDKKNLGVSYPIIKENVDYILTLRAKGYKVYLLTNITEDSYNYINNILDFEHTFDGGIYSYQVHLRKPDLEIFKMILNKYNLKPEETAFFDDKEKNVKAAKELDINGFVFNSIEDIKNNI